MWVISVFWRERSEDSDHPRFLSGLEEFFDALGAQFLWVDGNHEDHHWLEEFPVDSQGLRPVTPHITHVPRGSGFLVGAKKFVGLGGAHSIDRAFRMEGESWFPEELIQPEDLELTKAQGSADVLVTHEAPEAPWLRGSVGLKNDVISEAQRYLVGEARRALQPQLLIHGHHHKRYTTQVGRTLVTGLGCDGDWGNPNQLKANALTISLETLG